MIHTFYRGGCGTRHIPYHQQNGRHHGVRFNLQKNLFIPADGYTCHGASATFSAPSASLDCSAPPSSEGGLKTLCPCSMCFFDKTKRTSSRRPFLDHFFFFFFLDFCFTSSNAACLLLSICLISSSVAGWIFKPSTTIAAVLFLAPTFS